MSRPRPLTERTSQCQPIDPVAPSDRAKPVMLLMVMSALQACRRSCAQSPIASVLRLGGRSARDCSRTTQEEQESAAAVQLWWAQRFGGGAGSGALSAGGGA